MNAVSFRWYGVYRILTHTELLKLQVAHTYHEYPGAHTWDYWDTHVQEAFAFHLEHLEKVTE